MGQTDGRISCLCHSIYRTIPMLCCASLGKNIVFAMIMATAFKMFRVCYYTPRVFGNFTYMFCVRKIVGYHAAFVACQSILVAIRASQCVTGRQTDRQTDRGIAVG